MTAAESKVWTADDIAAMPAKSHLLAFTFDALSERRGMSPVLAFNSPNYGRVSLTPEAVAAAYPHVVTLQASNPVLPPQGPSAFEAASQAYRDYNGFGRRAARFVERVKQRLALS